MRKAVKSPCVANAFPTKELWNRAFVAKTEIIKTVIPNEEEISFPKVIRLLLLKLL